ncbi:MAG: hypothetical protein E7195_03350 [Peptococcaceae bacterium]|nr:hypothetical protein [Peptococcaceae bacterium]MBQ3509749.1 hypothetical protein [Peptococcaceae bacterium]
MEQQRAALDQELLLICEDMEQCLKRAEQLPGYNDSSSYYCRLVTLKEKIATERRLQEEISLPCRFLLEHFSLFLGKWDYSIGCKYGLVQCGRGMLSDIKIGEWGNVSLIIDGLEVNWRDADYDYMFYPDKVILRPKSVGKNDIYLYFSYAFKYGNVLSRFSDVANDPQTIYWHQELNQDN